MKRILIILLICICQLNVCQADNTEGYINETLNEKQLTNLKSIALLYGYARYFYPNPHTMKYTELEWYKFLVYVIGNTKSTEDNRQLIEQLSHLFSPLVPELSFLTVNEKNTLQNRSSFFYREHMGIGVRPIENIYTDSIIMATQRDEHMPVADSLYMFPLSDSLQVYLPLAISKPITRKPKALKNLEKEFKKKKFKLFNQSVLKLLLGNKDRSWALFKDDKFRYADLIVRWNIIEHFYPYYHEDGLNDVWDKCLLQAFSDASTIKSESAYYTVVASMLGKVKDSHIMISSGAYTGGIAASYLRRYYPPLELKWCADDIYISDFPDSLATALNKGDILLSVNDKSIHDLILEKQRYHSASTAQSMWEILTREGLLSSFTKDSLFRIRISGVDGIEREVKMKAEIEYYDYRNQNWSLTNDSYFIKEPESDIFYINLTHRGDSTNYDSFKEFIPQIQSSKAAILDLRGYPNGEIAESIIIHFAKDRLIWGDFRRPYYRFPHQKHVFYQSSDEDNLMPALPEEEHIHVPLYILIDHRAMSYGETLIEILKRNKVGTLVGQPTAGTNGDMTNIDLPCFGFSMTAIKDFSGYHGKGIDPDIYICPTLESIRNDEDHVLNETIRIIQKK